MRTPWRFLLLFVASAAFIALLVAAPTLAAAPPPPVAKWFASSQGIPEPAVRALALDLSEPARMVAETDYGTFRSTDFGASWAQIQDAETCGTRGVDIEIAPYDSSRIYIADYCEGVVATSDGGATWASISARRACSSPR
ncbi:MAG: hypothetical protein MUC34_17555 [Anaerolineae bacterium]|nr:hypothetical protein [Anaerolineae bacterium]